MRRLPLAAALLSLAMGATVVAGQVQPRLFGIGRNLPMADAFFSDTALHEIRLAVSSRDWQALKDDYQSNTYYPSDFRWRNQIVRNVGIRSRGTASRSPVKPGLRVDFDRYSTDQRFLGLKSVVLRNNTQDASNMHERLSMLLFRRMNVPAPREAFTRLYINEQYAGLYTIVESIDKAFLKGTFGEDDGHLYELDYAAGIHEGPTYRFEYLGADPGRYVPSPFKPETHEDDPRPEFIEQLIWTINETSNAVFRTAIAEYLDLEAFIRYVAVEMFVGDNEGFLGDYGVNNFYFYRFQNKNLFTFIPWDKSEAFKGGAGYSIFHNITDVPSWLRNRLMDRVISFPDLHDLYLNALLECARSADELLPGAAGGAGWLEREVEREYEQIRVAAVADPVKPFTNEAFDQAVSDLLAFARRRGETVTQQVEEARGTGALRRGRRFRG